MMKRGEEREGKHLGNVGGKRYVKGQRIGIEGLWAGNKYGP